MPQGADAHIQLPADGTGKRSDAESHDSGGGVLKYRSRNIPYQHQLNPAQATILNQASPAVSTAYDSSYAKQMIDGFDACLLIVESVGTNDANVLVEVFASDDGSTTHNKPFLRFYVLSPRTELVPAYAKFICPFHSIRVRVTTEATAPTGGTPAIRVKHLPFVAFGFVPRTETTRTAGAVFDGAAQFGATRGVYYPTTGYFEAATTANQGVLAFWNPATSPIDLLIRRLWVSTVFNITTAVTTNIALELIAISADPTGLTSFTPGIARRKSFLANLGTYRRLAGSAAITVVGDPLAVVVLNLDDVHGNQATYVVDSLPDIYTPSAEPGFGLAIRTPVALATSTSYALNAVIEEAA